MERVGKEGRERVKMRKEEGTGRDVGTGRKRRRM
jgi:hypothetical protein